MSSYVIEAYGMNDKVQDIGSGRQYINGDRMNVVIVKGYHDFIAGSDANKNRLSSGFSFPYESRVDDFSALDRFPVCMLWNKFISAKDSSRTKLKVKLRDFSSDSGKNDRNIDVNVDELLVAYVQALVKEFKQKHDIVSENKQKDHYILPIPNELTEYSQEYLIRSLSSHNVEITLIWREVAALMKFIDESKDKITFREGQKIKVVYLGEDSLESAIFELRHLKGQLVPVRSRPKMQKVCFSGFDYLCAKLKQKLSTNSNCADKTLWQIFNTREDFVKSALGKDFKEDDLPVEFEVSTDKFCKKIIKGIELEPDVEGNFSQSELLKKAVQLENESDAVLSLCDFAQGRNDENYDAILLCGDIATKTVSEKIQKTLSTKDRPVWASDTDLIVEGAKLYQDNLDNDRPTYLDSLPKLEIAYYSQITEDWNWISLVKDGQYVEGGKEYNSEEPFSKLAIPQGGSSMPIYLRVESSSEDDDGIRIDKRNFEKCAPEVLPLYITVSMKPAFGLAKLKIKDELNFYSDNGFIFDYSKMKKEPLPNLKKGLAYPAKLPFGVLFPANAENQVLKDICNYLEKRTLYKLNDEDIDEIIKKLPISRNPEGGYYMNYDLDLNTGSAVNTEYLSKIIKMMYENSYELTHKYYGVAEITNTLTLLTKFRVFYKMAPETLKFVCRNHLNQKMDYISPRIFFTTSCKVLYDNVEDISLIYKYFNKIPRASRNKIYFAQGLIWLLNYVGDAKNCLDRTTADNMVQLSLDMLEEQVRQNNFKIKFYTSTLLLLVSLKYRAIDPDFLTPDDSNEQNLNSLETIYDSIDIGIEELEKRESSQRYFEKVVHMHDEIRNFIEKEGDQNFLIALNKIHENIKE